MCNIKSLYCKILFECSVSLDNVLSSWKYLNFDLTDTEFKVFWLKDIMFCWSMCFIWKCNSLISSYSPKRPIKLVYQSYRKIFTMLFINVELLMSGDIDLKLFCLGLIPLKVEFGKCN